MSHPPPPPPPPPGGSGGSTSKRCAMADCSSSRMPGPGKVYCFVHRDLPPPPPPTTVVQTYDDTPPPPPGETPSPSPTHVTTMQPPGRAPPPPPPALREASGGSASTPVVTTPTRAPPPLGGPPVPTAANGPPPVPAAANGSSTPRVAPPPPPVTQAPPSLRSFATAPAPPATTPSTPPTPSSFAATPPTRSVPPPPPPSMPPPPPAATLNLAPPPVPVDPVVPPPRKLSLGERMGAFITQKMDGKSPPPPPPSQQTTTVASQQPPIVTRVPPVVPIPSRPPPISSARPVSMMPSAGSVVPTTPITAAAAASPSSSGSLHMRVPSLSRFSVSVASAGTGAPVFTSGSLDLAKLSEPEFWHLPHLSETVAAQIDIGLYAVHRMIAVLKRSLAQEDEHWRSQQKLIDHEAVKVDRLSRDMMRRTTAAWATWQRSQSQMAMVHITTNALITQHVLVPLLEFHASGLIKKKELDRDFMQREKECHAARIALQKDLSQCERLIDAWKEMKEKEDGPSSSAGSKFGTMPKADKRSSTFSFNTAPGNSLAPETRQPSASIFSKFKTAVSTLSYSSSHAVQEKLVVASAKYSDTLAACNRRLEILHTHELPHYLLELQKLELQRLDLTAQCLAVHAQLCEDRSRQLLADIYSTVLPQNAAALDPPADLDDTVREWADEHGWAPVHAPNPYALPVSLEEIKAGRILGNPDSVWHVSLGHLMAVQASTHPTLPVPRFLLLVLDGIRACNGGNGLAQEGVFRISPSRDEMAALKRALDSVGIAGLTAAHVPTDSVYLTSALLKEWLRALTDSVIPTKDYTAAIAIVKKAIQEEEGPGSSSNASPSKVAPPPPPGGMARLSVSTRSGSVSSSTRAHLSAFVATLPLVSQRVLQLLAEFAAELTSEDHKTNRMTIDNLAIVFAPCLLRSASEDPQEMIMNVRHEVRFVALLLAHMANAPSSTTMCVTNLQGKY